MTSSTCPRCGADATGNFCASCGASLGGRTCPACGAAAEPGARFCNGCGSRLAAAGDPPTPQGRGAPGGPAGTPAAGGTGASRAPQSSGDSSSQIGWWAAGLMMVFLIGVLGYPILVPQETREVNPGPTGGASAAASPFGDASSVDLNSMTPQQAATSLYTRVMTLAEAGDTTQVQFFLPMALSAHEQAEPLDPDGLYHYAALQRVGGQPAESIATAERILAQNPNHLLALYAAATAAQDLGRTAEARDYFQRLLDSWDQEMAAARFEYEAHAEMMPEVRAEAEAAVGG